MPIAAAEIAYRELFALSIGNGLAGFFREFQVVERFSSIPRHRICPGHGPICVGMVKVLHQVCMLFRKLLTAVGVPERRLAPAQLVRRHSRARPSSVARELRRLA